MNEEFENRAINNIEIKIRNLTSSIIYCPSCGNPNDFSREEKLLNHFCKSCKRRLDDYWRGYKEKKLAVEICQYCHEFSFSKCNYCINCGGEIKDKEIVVDEVQKEKLLIKQDDLKFLSKEDFYNKIEVKETFTFDIAYERERRRRKTILFLLGSTIIFALLGLGLYFLVNWLPIKNRFAILGIGSGLGLLLGNILGIILIVSAKKSIVVDFSGGYGISIGTNVFIGAFIGLFFGAITGSLFGLIARALNVILVLDLNNVLYGVLIWMVLGINIGVISGIFATYNSIGAHLGGIFAGIVVAMVGMVAIFGFDIAILIGGLNGGFIGFFISFYVKLIIDSSIGKIRRKSSAIAKSATKSFWEIYKGVLFSECLGICVFIVSLPIMPIILLLIYISTIASIKFGDRIKKSSFSVYGASVLLAIAISSVLGLINSYQTITPVNLSLVGATLGFVYSSFLLIAKRVSLRLMKVTITPTHISWKDQHTMGKVPLNKITSYYSSYEENKDELHKDEFLVLNLEDGTSRQIALKDLIIPNIGLTRLEVLQTIIESYLEQIKIVDVNKEKIKIESMDSNLIELEEEDIEILDFEGIEEINNIKDLERRYSVEINISDLQMIEQLLKDKSQIRLEWIVSITQLPKKNIIIIVRYLGRIIENGIII